MQVERKSEELNRSTAFDNKLRPTDFEGFVGQDKVRDRMLLAVKAAKERPASEKRRFPIFSARQWASTSRRPQAQ